MYENVIVVMSYSSIMEQDIAPSALLMTPYVNNIRVNSFRAMMNDAYLFLVHSRH